MNKKIKTEKILVVEDQEDSLYMLESLLKGGDYEVIIARNGIEALEKLKKDSVDLIVSDVLMPKMDGFQLCRKCKTDEALKKIPFVFYTATYKGTKDEKFALSLGAEKFLIKPIPPDVLLKVLRVVLKKRKKRVSVVAKKPIEEEVYLEKYNSRLIEKLEKKMLDTEKEKDRALHEQEKLETIVQSVGDGLFVLDEHKRIILANKALEQLSGYSEKEMIDRPYTKYLKFVYEVDGKPNKNFINDVYEKGILSKMSDHSFLINKDKTTVSIECSASPLKNRKGDVFGCVVVCRDITIERKVDKMKTEFVSLASHQLNTPLTGIKWFIELLKKEKAGQLNDGQKDLLSSIEFSNNRMIRLVSDLLNVSRIESGTEFVVEKNKKNIYKTIFGLISRYEYLVKKKKVKIEISKKMPKELILGIDERKIEQAFGNLISNAIKYSKNNTVIRIDFKETDKDLIFSFKNKGLGIPKAQEKRIFEKFFRADNIMTTETEGSGLGLYVVKAIVEAHEGKVWFESTENKTTTFYVSLPK